MRRVTVLLASSCLASCGQSTSVKTAKQQESIEITACRTTYPPGTGQFAALVHCEMGAAAGYVQQIDPSENDRAARIAASLESMAADVDAGRMTMQDWQTQATEAVHSLTDAKRTVEATSAVL